MTNTFLTLTGFAAPFTTPLSKYALALGAISDWFWLLRTVELEKDRMYLVCFPTGIWLLVRRYWDEVRVVKFLAGQAGIRIWRSRELDLPAKRVLRAIVRSSRIN